MYSVYIHIPFCVRRCAYCDFNTFAGQDAWLDDYVQALILEITCVAQASGEVLPVHTVFFGGGTPSLLKPAQFETILRALANNFHVNPDAEITIEANPGTVSRLDLQALRKLGINRLSLGIQSFRQEELDLLGRIHTVEDSLRAVDWARSAAFKEINLDLIFGLPGQTMEHWQATLNMAIRLKPEHLSLYALTIEENTPLMQWLNRGLITAPDDDVAADMYDWAGELLLDSGFAQYEISNWARWGDEADEGRDHRCQHNLQYWRNLPYLGFGAGAHGYSSGIRTANVLLISEYISRMRTGKIEAFPRSPANATANPIDYWTEIQETMMVGLRLTDEGISRDAFRLRFGQDLVEIFGAQIKKLVQNGLVEISDRLRLTSSGKLLGNRVFGEFVNADIRPGSR